ncbi:MAG: FKBP-type peptidyl-prolyl cis-trans isomerase [Verrucomicrobiae bacterium]|nr:FKBP-type peptidyl-prolyl cis-trans isomerase [Verrucomicrobiae bacterium]
MKHSRLAPLALSIALSVTALGWAQESAPKPETQEQKFGYAYGNAVARQLKKGGIPIDLDQFAQAMRDVFAGKESVLTDAEVEATFEKARQLAEQAKAEAGKAFLAENGKKEGVKTTASGLQYEVIKEGTGSAPAATDTVKVHYRGTLIDGTEFDSSLNREPISFPLNRVIPGWTEGLQLMKVGAKYRFAIPYNLAYGEAGSPPDIPPFSTLVFEVELLGIGE